MAVCWAHYGVGHYMPTTSLCSGLGSPFTAREMEHMLVSDPLQYSEGQLWPVVPVAGQRFFGRRCEIVFAGLPA